MAGIIKWISLLAILTALLAVIGPRVEAQIDCNTVTSDLNPCIPYVITNGPLGECCSGIQSLYSAAETTEDRQTICGCLKSLANSYPGNIASKAAELPAQCGLSIPYEISPSTDCSTVT